MNWWRLSTAVERWPTLLQTLPRAIHLPPAILHFKPQKNLPPNGSGNLIPEAGADAMAEAKALVVAAVNGGTTAASLILQAQEFLSAASETDAAFGTSAANFNNKVEVASNIRH